MPSWVSPAPLLPPRALLSPPGALQDVAPPIGGLAAVGPESSAPHRVWRCEGHDRRPRLHLLQRSQAQRGWRVPVQRAAAAGAAQRWDTGWASGAAPQLSRQHRALPPLCSVPQRAVQDGAVLALSSFLCHIPFTLSAPGVSSRCLGHVLLPHAWRLAAAGLELASVGAFCVCVVFFLGQNTPRGCAGPTRRSRAPCRRALGLAACDVSAAFGVPGTSAPRF